MGSPALNGACSATRAWADWPTEPSEATRSLDEGPGRALLTSSCAQAGEQGARSCAGVWGPWCLVSSWYCRY